MKHLFLLLTTIVLGHCLAIAQDPVVTIATKIANQASYVSGYDKTFKLIDPGSVRTWTAANFSNNNSAWDNIRCGSKTAATTATITTDFAIETPISRVNVELSRYKTGSSNRMTSMVLLVADNADMTNSTLYQADISTLPSTTGTPVTISIPVEAPAANLYYQLKIEMPKVSSEGVFSVNSLKYYPMPHIEAPGEHSATLDFTDKTSTLNAYAGGPTIDPGSEYAETGTNNLNNASFTVGDVAITLSKADGTIPPRWWESSTITPELRLNPDNVMTIEAMKYGCKLMEVKFLPGNVNASYYNSLEASAETNLGQAELVDKTWTAPATGNIDRLTLTFADYCRCGAIRITYYDEEEAVAGVETTTIDTAMPGTNAEYFNLQGTKVNLTNLTPGIYIVRRGNETEKRLIP